MALQKVALVFCYMQGGSGLGAGLNLRLVTQRTKWMHQEPYKFTVGGQIHRVWIKGASVLGYGMHNQRDLN